MKILIQATLAIIIAAWITYSSEVSGSKIYFLIGSWQVGISMTLALLLAFLVWLILSWLFGIWHQTKDTTRNMRHRLALKKERKLTEDLNKGFLKLLRGEWQQAERLFAPKKQDRMLPVNYLSAAYAAHMNGDQQKADQYLQSAQERFARQDSSALMVKACLLQQAGKHEETEKLLQQIVKKDTYNKQAAKWLYQIHQNRQLEGTDWQPILSDLKDLNVISSKEKLQLEVQNQAQKLKQINTDDLEAAYDLLPRPVRRSKEVLHSYAQRQIECGNNKKAEKLLRKYLERSMDDAILREYAQIGEIDPEVLYRNARKWLVKEPENAVILQVLAELSFRMSLWGEVRNYYSKAIDLSDDLRIIYGYARLEEKMGHHQEAIALYKKAIDKMNQAQHKADNMGLPQELPFMVFEPDTDKLHKPVHTLDNEKDIASGEGEKAINPQT